MKYACDQCNYVTYDKSNYNRHLKSQIHTHLNHIEPCTVQETDQERPSLLACETCNKSFSCKSSLMRHIKKNCSNSKSLDNIITLKQKLENENLKQKLENYEDLIQQYKSINEKLLEHAKNNKNTKVTNITNNNISVKNHINYIKDNYSNAPPLTALEDYSIIESNDELINDIIYNHNHKSLDQYLGNFLVKCYKKNNSSQQSIWNSDVSRVTYVIKELLANKKSLWNHDYKGIKTKNYIITPLLKYIKEYICDYIDNYVLDFKKLSARECQAIAERQLILGYVMQYIDTNLSEDIIKYIAPHFHVNKQNDAESSRAYDINNELSSLTNI